MRPFALYSCLALAAPALAVSEEAGTRGRAYRVDFGWKAEQSTFLYALTQMPDDYNFRMDYEPAKSRTTFSILKNDRTLFSFPGHKHAVFRIHKGILYYPVFHTSSSGCKIVAFDLEKRQEVWKTSLEGIGPISHSAYRNVIMLDVSDDVVVIRGHESLGDYVEILDRNLGSKVGHRLFNRRSEQETSP